MSTNAELRARLAEVNASIDELKLRLETLEAIRLPIQRQLDSVVYPVLTLPPEITSDIFLECLPPVPDLDSSAKAGLAALRAPLLFLQICSAWRRVASSTPRLWVYLHLNLENVPVQMEDPELEEFIADWFSRAGSCRLSLSILGYMGMEGFGSQALSAVIRRYAPQLQNISLRLERAHFEQLAGIGPFPMLQNLVIALPFLEDENANVEDGPGLWFLKIFSPAPQLCQLSYAGGAMPWMFSFPYAALSTLTCQSLSGDDFFDLLKSATLLEKFTCSVEDPDDLVSNSELLTHSHLRTLRFAERSSAHVFRHLRLPALEDLHLSLHIVTTADENRDILSFLAYSTSLRRFSNGSEISALSIEWFTVMPGLTDIQVSEPTSVFLLGFFSKLDRGQHNGFLPCLRCLAFLECVRFPLDSPVLGALASRCSADEKGCRLESFRYVCGNGYAWLEETTAIAFRELVNRGMKVHVGLEWKNMV
ncbi:hypothetical protein K438DRAFT_2020913 [Mycena galopus ATCC 62051]|nr:hypothetical protein K438DRAFT_2020913 [Mycena galopus ATCC 62051]